MGKCYFCNKEVNDWCKTQEDVYVCNECLTLKRNELKIFLPTTIIPNFFPEELFEDKIPDAEYADKEVVELVARKIEEDLASEVSEMFFRHLEIAGEQYGEVVRKYEEKKELLRIKAGKYEVVARGNNRYLEIYAITPEGEEVSIVNLNYILSEVIEDAIEDWIEREEIDEGTAVVGTPGEIRDVLFNLKKLNGDKYLEKAIDEDRREVR